MARRCWSFGRRTEGDATFVCFESVHISSATAVDERLAGAPLRVIEPAVVSLATRADVHRQTANHCTHPSRPEMCEYINSLHFELNYYSTTYPAHPPPLKFVKFQLYVIHHAVLLLLYIFKNL